MKPTAAPPSDAVPPTPTVPASPSMSPAGVARLTRELTAAGCFLEYGAGGSTRLAGSLNVPHIVSVESDGAFAQAVARAVTADGSRSALHSLAIDVGPTKQWGYPVDRRAMHRWPDYPLEAWERLKGLQLQPDLVLIDGRFRVACFLASLLHLPPGAPILFDDYVNREAYHRVERHAPVAETVGRMAVFRVPQALDHPALAADLARYCLVTN